MPHKDPAKRKAAIQRWKKEHPNYWRNYASNTPEARHATYKKRVMLHPEHKLWEDAKKRAKKKGIEFTILLGDIVIPTECPVFNILLERGDGERTDASPSLDRIDPNRGYVKENIWVISWRANHIKSNSSLEELEKLVSVLRQKRS